jgi:hypothetical protein
MGNAMLSQLSLSEAAKVTGQSKSTIWPATDLERRETALMQAQIDSLRQLGERLRNELDDVRKDRDAWRSQAERLLLTHSPGSAAACGEADRMAAAAARLKVHLKRW